MNFSEMLLTEKEICTCQACGKPKEPSIKELLKEFFQQQSAKSVQEELWRCFIAALGSSDMDNWTAFERSSLAFLYEKLTEFIIQLEIIHLKTLDVK